MPNRLTGLLSPYLRRRRIEAIRRYLDSPRILDYGCGIGVLADHVPPERYVGVDVDPDVVQTARELHPRHRFEHLGSFGDDRPYDTIIALAVIEHLPDPGAFLRWARGLLVPAGGLIVVTTPLPSLEWLHTLGGHLGICSSEGSQGHPSLLDRPAVERLGREAGLTMNRYERFLFGANQLAVFEGAPIHARPPRARQRRETETHARVR